MEYGINFNQFFELTQKELSKISGYNRYRSRKLIELLKRLDCSVKTNIQAKYEHLICRVIDVISSKKSLDEEIRFYLSETKRYAEIFKMKSFNLEQALAGEPVKLRNGLKAYVKYVMPKEYKGLYPLTGFCIKPNNAIWELCWTMEGKDTSAPMTSDFDIISMWEEK